VRRRARTPPSGKLGVNPSEWNNERMSDLQRRGSYTPRKTREQRAYRLVMAGGVLGAVGVVGLVLAVAGVVGALIPILALILAAICGLLFRSAVSRK
jgi:CDP-diglyceride synthetase